MSEHITDFEAFPKIGRLLRGCVVTEKIDGTNAQISISDDLSTVRAGSRTRWIEPGKLTDNYGFAGWVRDHEDDLRQLGPGRHFGEWWGNGIQRTYGLSEKRFSLFNTGRWSDARDGHNDGRPKRPDCCYVVPVLYAGAFDMSEIDNALTNLHIDGSRAAPGYMRPEGIVVYHQATGTLFKRTIEHDEVPKGMAA